MIGSQLQLNEILRTDPSFQTGNIVSAHGVRQPIEQEIERFNVFKNAGLDDLAIRLFDDPMDSLKLIGERVMPKFR